MSTKFAYDGSVFSVSIIAECPKCGEDLSSKREDRERHVLRLPFGLSVVRRWRESVIHCAHCDSTEASRRVIETPRCSSRCCPLLASWRVTLIEVDGARTVSDLCSFHERTNHNAFLKQELAPMGSRERLSLAIHQDTQEGA